MNHTDKTTTEIVAEREERYGGLAQTAPISQAIKAVIRDNWRGKPPTPVIAEALDMIANKLSRIVAGDAEYDDNYRDIAGYASLVLKDLDEREISGSMDALTCPETPILAPQQAQAGMVMVYGTDGQLKPAYAAPESVVEVSVVDTPSINQYAEAVEMEAMHDLAKAQSRAERERLCMTCFAPEEDGNCYDCTDRRGRADHQFCIGCEESKPVAEMLESHCVDCQRGVATLDLKANRVRYLADKGYALSAIARITDTDIEFVCDIVGIDAPNVDNR